MTRRNRYHLALERKHSLDLDESPGVLDSGMWNLWPAPQLPAQGKEEHV